MDDTILVYRHDETHFTLVLGDKGVVLSREEAEILFVDLGRMLQDDDMQE